MLMATPPGEDRITTAHRAKLAYIYVRQSSVAQVRQNQESTELQYRLVDRALQLGWPRERVQVIDEDLGRSGATSDGRHGFQRLIAEIGLGHAGLVLSLDASRLARNNRDWYQLVELCALFGVLIADGERLFDPGAYHDRLLLGLSGIMSEVELHQIKVRLHQGERQKAARGELRQALPAGLAQERGGAIILNPDEEVQARLHLVFRLFHDLGSAHAVVRSLRNAGLELPMRPLRGPAPHAVIWRPADGSRVLSILKNPGYAGAYVYGRHWQDPGRRRSGSPRSGTVTRAPEDWPVCLIDAHPGYISWEEFMANRKRLSDNINRYEANHRGAPRKGMALLQGIAVCGRCGRRMTLGYSGPHGEYPVYRCCADKSQRGDPLCQEVRALPLDAEVERLILALGESVDDVWHVPTTTAADRKRIVRLVLQEAILDQKRSPGRVLVRLVWQTGAVSDHDFRRTVHAYDNYAQVGELESRVRALNAAGRMDADIAVILNAEGFLTPRGRTFGHHLIYLLRRKWGIATVKINGTESNPMRWPDGSYSIQGAAEALGITGQTIFKWLRRGWLSGHQLARGMPWQITLDEERIPELRALVRHTSPSRRKAS